jgi:histidine ammonia-lyase
LTAVEVTGSTLSPARVADVARRGAPVLLSGAAESRIYEAEHRLRALLQAGRPIYGLTTGVGALDVRSVGPATNRDQQYALLRSHAAGVGDPMASDEVRAMLLARLNALAGGVSGVRLAVAQALVALLNSPVVPLVPHRGSIGASDMAPLAHAALVLVGEGRAFVAGVVHEGREALARAGLTPIDPQLRDAFALINGPAQSAGLGALGVVDACRLVRTSEVATALTMAAVGSRRDFLDARLGALRIHPGAAQSASYLRRLLANDAAEPRNMPLREPLSTRAAHQVHGALRDAIASAERVVSAELNAAVDNPVVLEDGWSTNSSGLPHAQHLALALDSLRMAVASMAVMSERRIARLLDPNHSGGLPAFLVHPRARSGVDSGLMIAQYTAAAVVAELHVNCVPASVQSVPVCGNFEDHAPMTALSAMQLARCIRLAETVSAIEILVAVQGVDLSGRAAPPSLAPFHDLVRTRVPVLVEDRPLGDDLATVEALVHDDVWAAGLPDDRIS